VEMEPAPWEGAEAGGRAVAEWAAHLPPVQAETAFVRNVKHLSRTFPDSHAAK